MMKFTVDRIEDGFAVLEKDDITHENVPACLLPKGAKEGSVLIFDGENYTLDSDAESEARERILRKHRNVFTKKEK